MDIGKTLRLFRLSRGLNQEEMAAGIITESYYSKVERGLHKIDAESLFKILKIHDFNANSFFEAVKLQDKTQRTAGILLNKIAIAQNNKDLEALDKIKDEIIKNEIIKNGREETSTFVKVWLEKAYVWVRGNNDNASDEMKKQARFLLLKNGWQTSSFYYLSQLINMFSVDEGYRLMLSAYQAYKEKKQVNSIALQYIAIASVNYLNSCWHQKGDKKYTQKIIDFLNDLPLDPVIGIEKVLASYYEALFNNDEEMKATMIKVLEKSRCLNLIKDTLDD